MTLALHEWFAFCSELRA